MSTSVLGKTDVDIRFRSKRIPNIRFWPGYLLPFSQHTHTAKNAEHNTEHSTEIYALHLKKNLKLSSLTLWENAPPYLTVAPPPHCRAALSHRTAALLHCRAAHRPTAELLKEKENGYGGKMEDEKRM
ncbi:hypothetical protein LR48_Vigan03g284800 [Vigna angularis]|uniref:Uncharacterized protein n=1 Tax=Phaseolus angularis TaxID=3914 RepID=A0A0L9U9W9_PHAAN|nr:hypothetical protein LR48_Vigan03g284800 [Vigna angularis]